MRRTILITLLVFSLAMGLCLLSGHSIHRVVEHALQLRNEAIEAMDNGDSQGTQQILAELAGHLKDNMNWLEMLCEHEDLHDLKAEIIDARTSIEFDNIDEFYQAIYRFGERMEHVSDAERLTLANLY